MQAIITKYHGPTATKAGRISAKCHSGKVMVEYDHASSDQHRDAAEALVNRMGWQHLTKRYTLASGQSPDGSGECFVFVERDAAATNP